MGQKTMLGLERYRAKPGVFKRYALGFAVLTAVLSAAALQEPANAQENAKWFVVRHDQTGDCWTALLIEVNGAYRHEFAQTAGGPYDSKAEALQREKQLEQEGTCKKTEMQ